MASGPPEVHLRSTRGTWKTSLGRYCRCVTDAHKWVVQGERLVDDTPHVRVSLADVELPDRDAVYPVRLQDAPFAMTAVLDEQGERLLLMRRHRFIVDRWVWELPGGYVDDGEDLSAAAAREVEEETGWRPQRLDACSCPASPSSATPTTRRSCSPARGARKVGEPGADEAAEVAWVPLGELPAMIARGLGGAGEVDGCAGPGQVEGLVGLGGQDLGGQGRVVGVAGIGQCLGQVPLGDAVLVAVVGGPPASGDSSPHAAASLRPVSSCSRRC